MVEGVCLLLCIWESNNPTIQRKMTKEMTYMSEYKKLIWEIEGIVSIGPISIRMGEQRIEFMAHQNFLPILYPPSAQHQPSSLFRCAPQ